MNEPITCPHENCGYQWTPRKSSPKRCPQCQNPLWRSPKPKRKKAKAATQEFTLMDSQVNSDINFEPKIETVEVVVEAAPEEPLANSDTIASAKQRAEALLRRLNAPGD